MAAQPSRFARQILVPEVGTLGQARLSEHTARVDGPGLSHAIAVRYARRAGLGDVAEGPIEDAGDLELRHAAPRSMVLGARAALRALREGLGR